MEQRTYTVLECFDILAFLTKLVVKNIYVHVSGNSHGEVQLILFTVGQYNSLWATNEKLHNDMPM